MPSNNYGENKVVFKIEGESEGEFVRRVNRFLGMVKINGEIVNVHIHDPGRLEELLYPGNMVLLKRYHKYGRKTSWEIIASKLDERWIFTNSKFHSKIAENILKGEFSPFGRAKNIVSEVRYGKSRLDFYIEDYDLWIEVKGCTLLKESMALFPDAPTVRGRRHVEELIRIRELGSRAAIIFLVFVPAKYFSPNYETDPDFSHALEVAHSKGVEIYPISLNYNGREIIYEGELSVRFRFRN